MYSAFPTRDQITIRSSLVAAWIFVGISGIGGVFMPSTTILDELGPWIVPICAAILVPASASAAIAVSLNMYRIEWVAAWFAAAGGFGYAFSLWYLTFTSNPTRLQAAGLATTALMFYIYRVTSCAAHARRLRTIHNITSNTGEVRLPDAS